MNGGSRTVDALLRHERVRPRLRLQLACEVLWTYVRVRRLLARHDIARVVAELRGDADDRLDPATVRHVARRIGHATRRTLAILPADSRCLVRSLVVLRMMARRGARCDLSIGARSGPEFEAHAWVEHDGQPVLPTLGYAPLTVI